MRTGFIIFFLFIYSASFGQDNIFPEQIAFNYFESNLIKEHLDSEVKLFINKEIKEYNNNCFPNCENDSLSENYLYVATNNIYPAPTDSFIKAQKEHILTKNIISFNPEGNNQFVMNSKLFKSKKIRQVYIYEHFSIIPNLFLVRISVESVEIELNFFIEIDRSGNVTRWCSGKRV